MFFLTLYIVWKEKDLPVHLDHLPLQGKESLSLVSQQKETEDYQNIAGEFSCRRIKEVGVQTKKVVIFRKKPRRVDQKTQGDELQETLGPRGVPSQGKKALIIGFLEVFPTAGNVLEEIQVHLFVSSVNFQTDLSVTSKKKITL